MRELSRYDVVVGALQETRWFSCGTYEVGDSMVLTSGRSTPGEGQTVQRGEGVALVLRGPALAAWKLGGQQWNACSSRCVTAVVQMNKRPSSKVHLVSCYAPTRAASREVKEAFFQELENIISSIPPEEMYIILGDFNARVGSRVSAEEEWSSVRGPHGFGDINDSGKELLSFLSLHQATVCNTWFEKRDIHKHTWQHPKSKQWSCIDYVVMRQRERSLCLDVATRRGTECNTDHHLVVMKLQLERSSGGTGRKGVKTRKLDVTRLKEGCGDEEESMKDRYLQEVLQRAGDSWCESAGVEHKWSAVKTALTNAAEEVLGKADRLQPDWFQESIAQLQPLLAARNAAYSKWLGTKSVMDLSRFRQARNAARRAIRKAKNDWFQDKATSFLITYNTVKGIETERFGGKKVWKAIRDMQRGRRGLLPRRNAVIQDEMGEPCNDKNAQQQRWRRHFTKVFNIRS